MTTQNRTNQNKVISKYNDEATDAIFSSLMGADVWATHKPTRNLSDIISSTSNDNTREA